MTDLGSIILAADRLRTVDLAKIAAEERFLKNTLKRAIKEEEIERYIAIKEEYKPLINDARVLAEHQKSNGEIIEGVKKETAALLSLGRGLQEVEQQLTIYWLRQRRQFQELLAGRDYTTARRTLKKLAPLERVIKSDQPLEELLEEAKTKEKRNLLGISHEGEELANIQEGLARLSEEYRSRLDHVADWNARIKTKNLLTRVAAYAEAARSLENRLLREESPAGEEANKLREAADDLEHNVGRLYDQAKRHWKEKLLYYTARAVLAIVAVTGVIRIEQYFTKPNPHKALQTIKQQQTTEQRVEKPIIEKNIEKNIKITPPASHQTSHQWSYYRGSLETFAARHPEFRLLLYADKDAHQLRVYERRGKKLQFISTARAIFGRPGPKRKPGDHRTPEGVYRVDGVALSVPEDPRYGGAVITLEDRALLGPRRAFPGIVITGTRMPERERALQEKRDATNGGIVLANEDVRKIARLVAHYGTNKTAVMIEDDKRPIYR